MKTINPMLAAGGECAPSPRKNMRKYAQICANMRKNMRKYAQKYAQICAQKKISPENGEKCG